MVKQSKNAEKILIEMIDYVEETAEQDDSFVTEELVSRLERLLITLKERKTNKDE